MKFFIHENKGNTLQILTQKHRDHHRPTGYYSPQLISVVKGLPPCMKAISAIDMLCKQKEKIIMGLLLFMFLILLNLH